MKHRFTALLPSLILTLPAFTSCGSAPASETSADTAALAIYSNQHVLPALYETAFNYKYLRDEDSIAMFEIIKNSLVYDKLWNYAEGNNSVYFLSQLMGKASPGRYAASAL